LFWEMLRTFDFRSNPLEQVQKEVARWLYTTQCIGDYHNPSLPIHENHDSWWRSISYPFLVYILDDTYFIYIVFSISISLLYRWLSVLHMSPW
jgi:hypothetical protein